MTKIEFCYRPTSPNEVHTHSYAMNHIEAEVTVYTNTDTILELLDDVICEWDMLRKDQREFLCEIAGQIAKMSGE